MSEKRVGLVGCGTIGSHLATAIDSNKIPGASLVALFDVEQASAERLRRQLKHKPTSHNDFASFLQSGIDLVVEAASQEAVRTFAIQSVDSGKDLMLMSVGALADGALREELFLKAREAGTRIYVPSGAIAGIDAIRAVKDLIQEIVLTTTKSPASLAGAPFFERSGLKAETISERTVIYSGNASEAVRLFPANVNVAAVLSLAGIGPDKTKVRIVADPAATTNRHEISAKGSFGEIQVVVNNVPSPGNPKTSYLAVLSAIECLRSICEDSVRIGS